MRSFQLLYFTLLLSSLLFSSCVKEEIARKEGEPEGIPVTTTLHFRILGNDIQTRAAQEPEIENAVANLYVFIFDAQGEKRFGEFYNTPTFQNQSGTITISTQTLQNAQIIGIANVNESQYDLNLEKLQAIHNQDDLEQLVCNLKNQSLTRGGHFLMAGQAIQNTDPQHPNLINITTSEELNASLLLKRVDAKITFQVSAEIAGATHVELNLDGWKVLRVPKKSYLINFSGKSNFSGQEPNPEFHSFDTEGFPFEEITKDPNTLKYIGGNFTFYMPENLEGCKKSISTEYSENYSPADAYALRELKENGEGLWTYANELSSYVILSGRLSYQDIDPGTNQPRLVQAQLKLTIHLGYAENNPNDYATSRNTHYTYHVKIMGIHEICVEVEEQSEGRPGFEGDVIFTEVEGRVFDLDAHYETRKIELFESDITEQTTWIVDTPFGEEDYQWIKFTINNDWVIENVNLNDIYIPYPGTQFYSPDVTYNGKDARKLYDIQQLLKKLNFEKSKISSLPEESIFMKNTPKINPRTNQQEHYVTVTVYIDEYLYFHDPTRPYSQTNLSLWKESTKGGHRYLHIISTPASYSNDHHSSISHPIYSFKQCPIITIYNPDLATSGWGIESFMETQTLQDNAAVSSKQENSPIDGRRNTIGLLGIHHNTLYWTNLINVYDNSLLSNSNSPVYASLLRNRDENGDGKIDESEIKWYLAAIDQYKEMYIAQAAYSQEYYLYPYNSYNGRIHYISSTYANERPKVLWAEEGASTGARASANDQFYYRCVRNLGIDDNDPSSLFERLIKRPIVKIIDITSKDNVLSERNDTSFIMDLSNMNPNALRIYSENIILPSHDHVSSLNQPYKRFQVLSDPFPLPMDNATSGSTFSDWDFSNRISWEEIDQNKLQDNQGAVCPEGYRPCTQIELLILSIGLHFPEDEVLERSAWKRYFIDGWVKDAVLHPTYLSQTSFAFKSDPVYHTNSNDPLRNCFLYNNSGNQDFWLQETSDPGRSGFARCVRDIE